LSGGARKRIRPARETIPATGKKNPPFSPADVAMRLAVLAADSMTDPSMIMLGTTGAVRPDMAVVVDVNEGRGTYNHLGVRQI
jgi:hypothetical protein